MATPRLVIQQLAARVQLLQPVHRNSSHVRRTGCFTKVEPALMNDVMRLMPDVLARLPDFSVMYAPDEIMLYVWVKQQMPFDL